MCLIVDTNVAHRVFLNADDADFGELHQCIRGRRRPDVRIVYGGRLSREYLASGKIRRIVLELDRAGRARKVRDGVVDGEEQALIDTGICVSDDPHIIALARVSRVNLLCSHDQDLHRDFTDPRLLDNPRGRVYQSPAHEHLLRENCG